MAPLVIVEKKTGAGGENSGHKVLDEKEKGRLQPVPQMQ